MKIENDHSHHYSTAQTFIKQQNKLQNPFIGMDSLEPSIIDLEKNDEQKFKTLEDRIFQLESKVHRTSKYLHSIYDQNKGQQQNQQLEDQTKNKIALIEEERAKYKRMEERIKIQVNEATVKSQSQLKKRNQDLKTLKASYKTEMQKKLKNTEKLMEDEFMEIKKVRQRIRHNLNKKIKEVSQSFSKQETQKQQTMDRLSQKLEQARRKIGSKIELQHKKRQDYDQIISQLLQQTINQSEKAIRRRIY